MSMHCQQFDEADRYCHLSLRMWESKSQNRLTYLSLHSLSGNTQKSNQKISVFHLALHHFSFILKLLFPFLTPTVLISCPHYSASVSELLLLSICWQCFQAGTLTWRITLYMLSSYSEISRSINFLSSSVTVCSPLSNLTVHH